MPRKSRPARAAERERVLAVLRTSPAPLTALEVLAAYTRETGRSMAYTTLRVRLAELIESGQVQRSLQRRNTTYTTAPQATPLVEPAQESAIPLSSASRLDLALLRGPREHRQPVGYDVDFWRGYEPGTTWYLPFPLRARLLEAGRTAYQGAPAGTYARDIMERLVIDLSWGSSQLEGNKYSRIDTEDLIKRGEAAPGTSAVDRQMILNHKSAIEFLVEGANEIAFNRYTIMNLHALLAENLVDGAENEGALRIRPVGVGTSLYTPTSVPQVITECFDAILQKAERIPDPLEQSFFVMVHLPYLQPFIDVNKRTSRLAANIPLIRANLCPLSFVDVPEPLYTYGTLAIYELRRVDLLRDVFAWAYERSCAQFKVLRAAMGEPDPIRLNYRTALRAVVADVVRNLTWPADADLFAAADAHAVPPADRASFVQAATSDLRALRLETLARYGLRPSEYEAWREAATLPQQRP